MANRRRRIRCQRTAHGARLGHRASRHLHVSGRRVLLQAMGRQNPQGRWPRTRGRSVGPAPGRGGGLTHWPFQPGPSGSVTPTRQRNTRCCADTCQRGFPFRVGTPTGSRGEQSPKPELDPYGRKALRWVPLTTFDLIHVRLPHRMRRMDAAGRTLPKPINPVTTSPVVTPRPRSLASRGRGGAARQTRCVVL